MSFMKREDANGRVFNLQTALGCIYRTFLRAAANTPSAYRGLSASSFALPWRTAMDWPQQIPYSQVKSASHGSGGNFILPLAHGI